MALVLLFTLGIGVGITGAAWQAGLANGAAPGQPEVQAQPASEANLVLRPQHDATSVRTPSATAAEGTPLNAAILDIIATYPADGRFPYDWEAGVHTDGTTKDIIVNDVVLTESSPTRGVHCSGITFEVWLRAIERATGRMDTLASPDELLAIKAAWYIREGTQAGMVDALIDRGLGWRVEGLEDLQPGDLVQFWRNSGRGHSAVFVKHRTNRSGEPRGMVFWSAQRASEGIGMRFASIGEEASQITPGRLFAVRPLLPKSRPDQPGSGPR